LSGLGQTAKSFELKQRQIAPQKNPVVDGVNGLEVRIDFLKQRVAKGVERAKGDRLSSFGFRFAAIARRGNHTMLHFRRSFVGERKAEDFRSG